MHRETVDPQPVLPPGVTYDIADKSMGHNCNAYEKSSEYLNEFDGGFTPSDLRAIADHMEWRKRQEMKTVNDQMVHAAIVRWFPGRTLSEEKYLMATFREEMRATIQAALREQPQQDGDRA